MNQPKEQVAETVRLRAQARLFIVWGRVTPHLRGGDICLVVRAVDGKPGLLESLFVCLTVCDNPCTQVFPFLRSPGPLRAVWGPGDGVPTESVQEQAVQCLVELMSPGKN